MANFEKLRIISIIHQVAESFVIQNWSVNSQCTIRFAEGERSRRSGAVEMVSDYFEQTRGMLLDICEVRLAGPPSESGLTNDAPGIDS